MISPITLDEQLRLEAKTMIFDVDGTLIDSTPLHVRSWEAAFQEAGLDVPTHLIHGQMGRRKPEIVETLLAEIGASSVSRTVRRRIIERKARLFADHIHELAPVSGALEMIEWFKKCSVRICLATSATRPEVDTHIQTMGIKNSVDLVLSSEDVRVSKPDPEILHLALSRLDAQASSSFFVGDSPHDIGAAVAADVRGVGVLTGGYTKEQLYDAGAWLVLDTVAALKPRS